MEFFIYLLVILLAWYLYDAAFLRYIFYHAPYLCQPALNNHQTSEQHLPPS